MRFSRDTRRRLPEVVGPDDAAAVVQRLVCDDHHTGQLVLGVDNGGRACGVHSTCSCDDCRDVRIDSGAVLVALAHALGAVDLVLVTFVDDDRLAPTPADLARFEGLSIECLDGDVVLLDHLLFSGHRWRSVREVSAERFE